jgi:hypothetical protein
LCVVHGDHERRTAGKEPYYVQYPSRQHPRLRQRTTGPGNTSRQGFRGRVAEKCDLHGSPPRSGKHRKDLPGDVAEQVIKRRKRERSLR